MLIFFPVFKKLFAFKVILHRCNHLTVRVNFNKSFESIEINNSKLYLYRGGIKKIYGINIRKKLEKDDIKNCWKKPGNN